jgi:hypothetical protein
MKMIAPVARDIKEGTVEIHHPSGNRELDLFPCTVYKAGKIRRYSKEDKMFKDV